MGFRQIQATRLFSLADPGADSAFHIFPWLFWFKFWKAAYRPATRPVRSFVAHVGLTYRLRARAGIPGHYYPGVLCLAPTRALSHLAHARASLYADLRQ